MGLIVLSVAEGTREPSRIVPASDVADRIAADQPSKFDDCIIVGDLDLSALKIKGPVHFNNTLFQNSANFNSTTFNGDANFGNSRFNGPAYFGDSRFNAYADFSNSTFNSTAYFSSTIFNNTADFGNSAFDDTTLFMDSIFNGDAYFSRSTHKSLADFRGSRFNVYGFFFNSVFNGITLFKGSNFNDTIYFAGSKFNNITDFTDAQFNKEAQFYDAQFAGVVSFSTCRFTGDALFENTTFHGKLSLSKTRYDKLYIKWYNIKDGLIYDEDAYMSLMKNFKSLGYLEDYNNCYYQYNVEHRDHPWNIPGEPFLKIIDFLSEWSYGYGVRPMNPLLSSIILIISFGLFWRSKGIGRTVEYNDEYFSADDLHPNRGHTVLKWIEPQTILDAISPFTFSFILFISAGKFLVDPPELPEPMKKPKLWTKRMFDIEKFLGGVFLALFLIAISSTMIRAL